MKLVSYLKNGRQKVGLLVNGNVYDASALHKDFPHSMEELLLQWEDVYPKLLLAENEILHGRRSYVTCTPVQRVQLMAPVPSPASCRDGYAFRQHVAAARRNRGVPMIPEFDQYPIFYFTNHKSIQGPGKIKCMPDHFQKLDFELEVAIVICKQGRNIRAEEADEYIGGLMIMNDMSARKLQMEEMLLNLGPAKGKDFSTVIGPWLVTTDELQQFEVSPKEGHIGKSWKMK